MTRNSGSFTGPERFPYSWHRKGRNMRVRRTENTLPGGLKLKSYASGEGVSYFCPSIMRPREGQLLSFPILRAPLYTSSSAGILFAQHVSDFVSSLKLPYKERPSLGQVHLKMERLEVLMMSVIIGCGNSILWMWW